MTDFRVVLARAGFPQLADKFKAIRPAPTVKMTKNKIVAVSSEGTYAVASHRVGPHAGTTTTYKWQARKWD